MTYQLVHPETGKEPLFKVLKQKGFVWDEFNSREETARAEINFLEESDFIPEAILKLLRKRLAVHEGYLDLKLDWFLGKNIRGLMRGQRYDSRENVASLRPGRLPLKYAGPDRISDHRPLYADLDLA